MWFLECDGEQVFDKKRIWLRPGTQFMLGRTRPKAGSPGFYLEHNSVSRQHLLVSVDEVRPGDATRTRAKSKLTVTDNSKLGTTVDGAKERLFKQSRTLDKNEHSFKLGNYPDLFRIKWVPILFSFTSLKKAKRSDDALAPYCAILEPLDIKCLSEFASDSTSHTITAKRNTAAVLESLVNGRYLVTEPFVDALAAVGRKESPQHQSLLEIDFDAHWPKELDFLPPPGREPNPRPEHSDQYLPNEGRAEMFAKYTFIFHSQAQYSSLMPVITGGGGKGLLRPVQPNETDISDMVEYVREVAGKKGVTSFNLSQQVSRSEKGGIVIVQCDNKVPLPGYYEQLDSALGQRSIEQREFLDAILDVDASKLKQELIVEVPATRSQDQSDRMEPPRERRDPVQHAAEDTSMAGRDNQSPARDDVVPTQKSAKSEPESSAIVPRRRARQRTTQPRYRGFDDFEPEESLKYSPPSPSPSPAPDQEPSQAPSVDPMEAEYPENEISQVPGTQRAATQRSATQQSATQQSSRKRKGEPLEEDETTRDVVDGILKGAGIMKRRKLEEEARRKAAASQAGEDEEMNDEVGEAQQPAAAVKKPRKRKEKEMDVMALVNERRQADEEARQADEENLRTALEGMDVADIRNLAQIEEMDIARKDPPPRARYRDGDVPSSDRWDERWNGRKNFKKFRRQGADDGYERQRTRVIVPLEEVQKKAYGVGEDYWLESVEDTRRKEKEKRKEGQSQRKSQAASPSLRTTQSQRSKGGKESASAGAEQDSNRVHEIADDDSNGSDNDANRFRRRIRNSRITDAETAEGDEIDPYEIAGTARDGAIEAAAHGTAQSATSKGGRASNSATPQTQTLRADVDKRKRAANDQGSGTAAKRVKAGASAAVTRKAKTPTPVEDSDEEDALKFRRRRRG